jgi:hypothetical protein
VIKQVCVQVCRWRRCACDDDDDDDYEFITIIVTTLFNKGNERRPAYSFTRTWLGADAAWRCLFSAASAAASRVETALRELAMGLLLFLPDFFPPVTLLTKADHVRRTQDAAPFLAF